MPKNVIGRLINLENEMKTVLSICDIRNSDSSVDKAKKQVDKSSGINSDSPKVEGAGQHKTIQQHLNNSRLIWKRIPIEKGSRISQTSLTTIKEVDVAKRREQHNTKIGETPEEVDAPQWNDNVPAKSENVHEQDLRELDEILSDISQNGSDSCYSRRMTVRCSTCKKTYDCACKNKRLKGAQLSQEDNAPTDGKNYLQNQTQIPKKITIPKELVGQVKPKIKKDTQSGDYHSPIKSPKKEPDKEIADDEAKSSPTRNKSPPALSRLNLPKQDSNTVTVRFKRTGLTEIPEENGKISNIPRVENVYKCEVDQNVNNQMVTRWIEGKEMEMNKEISSRVDSPPERDRPMEANQAQKTPNAPIKSPKKLYDLIQKSRQKIEEMRQSKALALAKAKVMKEKYEKLVDVKNEMENRLQQLAEKNEGLVKELKEAEQAKKQILQELENFKKVSTESSTAEFKSEKNVSDDSNEKISVLDGILPEMNISKDKGAETHLPVGDKSYEYHILFRRQEAAYRRLVQGIGVLERVIKNNRTKEKRVTEFKMELKRRAIKTQRYLEKLTCEKSELANTVNNLKQGLDERQALIEEVKQEIAKKDEELEKMKNLLKEKSDALEETSKELELIREKSMNLEEQVKTLRKSIENFDMMHQNLLKERQSFEEMMERIKQENVTIQGQLNSEKDSILIKNKIIEDQQETIKQLREKSDDAKSLINKIQSLERMVNLEREEKLEQQETIERLRWKKEELKSKIKSLEADLLLAPQEVVRDLQKTQTVLQELENQVQIKQREWEILLQSLAREKEQACNVAAFATKKLIQTTSDFQRQSDAQKKLYKILTDNLVDKKKRTPEGNDKVKMNVRFSDDVITDDADEEHEEKLGKLLERTHGHSKLTGILKKTRDWRGCSLNGKHYISSATDLYKEVDFSPDDEEDDDLVLRR